MKPILSQPNYSLKNLDPVPVLFLGGTSLLALILGWHLILTDAVRTPTVIWAIAFGFLTNLGITAGYHRLWAHRTYQASPIVQWLLLFLGSANFQNSAWIWCRDHRRHHRHVDFEEDPYAITKGFWFAHMGWMLIKYQTKDAEAPVPADLANHQLLAWQHRNYVAIATFSAFVFPSLVGGIWGDAWGGFVLAGLVRLVVCHHVTFFINSLCHMWGTQPYSTRHSARDNPILAFLTNGEGYHNYHHEFEGDYRNGVRWYDWDPTKWFIRGMAALGLTSKLRRVPAAVIEKARLNQEQLLLAQKHQHLKKASCQLPLEIDHVTKLRTQLDQAIDRLRALLDQYRQTRVEYHQRASEFYEEWLNRKHQLKQDLVLARRELKHLKRQWRSIILAAG